MSYLVLIGLVGVERIAELILAQRHLRWYLDRGGREYGADHYPVMVTLHTALLVGCLVEVMAGRPFLPALGWPMLVLVVLAQALRWWCIATLGPRWTTRVVVLPGVPPIRRGPYRILHHPNYLAVVVEGAALPLVHTAYITATIFTIANAALLWTRIRVENTALAVAFPR